MSRAAFVLLFCMTICGCWAQRSPNGSNTPTTVKTESIETGPPSREVSSPTTTTTDHVAPSPSSPGEDSPSPKKPLTKVPKPGSPGARLAFLASQRSDYRLFVGVPLANPSRWEAVTKAADGYLLLGEQGKLSLADVDAFIVAYPNGQLVDENMANLKLPPGITGLSPVLDRDLDRLQLSDLKSGNQIIQIKYDRSPAAPNDRNRYSTSLNNLSKEKIKVVRFAGYRRENQEWKISTVTGKFFSAEEFSAWYGLEDSKWILPGKTVVDMNNYGSPPMLWAYHCETESGRSFVAGAVVE